jgi:hypothetical protein
MKKTLTILALAVSASIGFSQGTVSFYSISSTYTISTNGTAANGTTTGKIDATANDYYFALLTQAYTGNAPASNPLTGGWTFSGALANNSTLLAGGIGNTADKSLVVAGWTPGTEDYVEIVGWSASLGTTWAQIQAEIGTTWIANGYYGVSGIGAVTSGGAGTPATLPAPIFSPTGVSSGFDLNGVSAVPEPTTIALIGLGGLGLAMIRRRK